MRREQVKRNLMDKEVNAAEAKNIAAEPRKTSELLSG